MRILFLTMSKFSNYPTYKRAIGTGEALARKGHSVGIVVLDCTENRNRMRVEAPHCQALWFKGNLLYEVYSKLLYIRKWKPDVVYSTSYSIHNLAGLRIFLPWRLKFVIEFCELYSRYPGFRLNWWIWEMLAVMENRYLLCASNYLYLYFKKTSAWMRPPHRILYSPYAFPDYLVPIKTEKEAKKRIVYMASIGRGYGAFEVLEAFEHIHNECPDVILEMIGNGSDKDEAVRWIEEHGMSDVAYIRGFVPENELNDYFSRATVFVVPMHNTIQDKARCPSKLFYYLPYNKPVVTCAIGNPYEILGDYGFYYHPLDVVDMARAFVSALNAADGFSYPKNFINLHSWANRADQFEKWIVK